MSRFLATTRRNATANAENYGLGKPANVKDVQPGVRRALGSATNLLTSTAAAQAGKVSKVAKPPTKSTRLALKPKNGLAAVDENAGVAFGATTTGASCKPLETISKRTSTTSKIPRLGSILKGSEEYDPQLRQGFSAALLPPNVENIDYSDGDNCLLTPEYVNDIYSYLRSLERHQTVKNNFLSVQREMTPKMRSVLVDWLINVHSQFKLLPETLYMGVSIMDRFFQSESVAKDKIQLVGVTAFFIASKFEEIYPPDLMDYVTICDQLYSKKEIIKMEMVILRTLKFELGRPLPLHFLRRNSKAAHADPKIHTMAKYLMELTLIDHECAAWSPSLLAASALYITLRLLSNQTNTWNPTLAYYSSYTEDQITPCIAHICKLIKRSERSRFQNCRKKYSSAKLLEISKSPEFNATYISEMAELA